MSPIDDLVSSMGAVIVDPNGPAAKMNELANQLTQTTLASKPQDDRAAKYYRLNLEEIPTTFKPLSASERSDPRVQAVLEQYSSWFDAEHYDLWEQALPKDEWTLDVLSRAMVETIVTRAKNGDARWPPCSPDLHPHAPFWSRPNPNHRAEKRDKQEWYGSDVLDRLWEETFGPR